ncbi:mevalonate kinase [Acidobacteriota bacterium]
MKITTQAYARAGLLGNPSDGYFGKIVAVSVRNYSSRVCLEESDILRIEPHTDDRESYPDIAALHNNIQLYGYYGGVRLIKAAIKKFYEYCREQRQMLHDKNFKISYESNIPRQLGLGGSSAIITAAIRALMKFYEINIPKEVQPSLILDAELKELGINAGFMDRVVQVYEGCVYMDLNRELVETRGYGHYENLDPKILPPLFLAFKPELGKVSGSVLNPIRVGYDRGDPFVLETLDRIMEIADEGRHALLSGRTGELHNLMNENFDLRSRIMKISESNRELIETARRCGASAKFAGSGGTIIGMYEDEKMFDRLKKELGKFHAQVIRPEIV